MCFLYGKARIALPGFDAVGRETSSGFEMRSASQTGRRASPVFRRIDERLPWGNAALPGGLSRVPCGEAGVCKRKRVKNLQIKTSVFYI